MSEPMHPTMGAARTDNSTVTAELNQLADNIHELNSLACSIKGHFEQDSPPAANLAIEAPIGPMASRLSHMTGEVQRANALLRHVLELIG